MKILSEREDIIIIKADKGGVVITGVGDYVKEANQQLGSTEFSKKLPNDTTELNRTNISTASIEELETLGLLDENTTIQDVSKNPQKRKSWKTNGQIC